MPAALIISFVEWAGAVQRPHHLALGLARRGWQVDYACPGYLHRRGRRVASGLELPPGLRVLEPPALPGGSRLAVIGALNQWLMARSLAAARPAGASWDVVIFNDPRWSPVAQNVQAARSIFDCMDDLSATAPSAEWAARGEAQALRVAGRVWTGTASLADRLAGRHPSVRFIPCGVEAERFANPDPEAVEAARAGLPPGDGPLAGYFGVLNERVDMRRVEALLSVGWRVLLIGPATSRAPQMPATERLRYLGPRPYVALPAYLVHFDLALIPYDTTGPHRFLYPVKALEYLAGGKPVLTTPLPDVVRFLSDYVELADTPQDWAEAGRRLLADRAAAQARAARGCDYARSRSWDAMVDEMECDMREEGARR